MDAGLIPSKSVILSVISNRAPQLNRIKLLVMKLVMEQFIRG